MTQSDETRTQIDIDEVAFHESVRRPSNGRNAAVRLGIVAGSALLLVVGAVAAMGASPAPSTGADPVASSAPEASAVPKASGAPETKLGADREGRGGMLRGFGPGPGGIGIPGGFREITVSAIDGSNVSLKTEDGWSRTITVTDATKLTKAGATITLGDLAVGDHVRFAQERATDGTYSVTALVVVLPTVGGEVTAIDGNTLTVTQRGGTTATIHVDGSTTYRVKGADGAAAGSLADIKVGSFIVAEGTQRSDGSLDAASVHAGLPGRDGPKGPGFPGHRQADPNASPAPSAATS